jgi:hypothetical protein
VHRVQPAGDIVAEVAARAAELLERTPRSRSLSPDDESSQYATQVRDMAGAVGVGLRARIQTHLVGKVCHDGGHDRDG